MFKYKKTTRMYANEAVYGQTLKPFGIVHVLFWYF